LHANKVFFPNNIYTKSITKQPLKHRLL
jgi:hypothetical protein